MNMLDDNDYQGLHLLPEHMRESMQAYIMNGDTPGGFLGAVLENDFMKAAALADDINRARLWDYANFLYNYAPAACYGSPQKMNAWINSYGLRGQG